MLYGRVSDAVGRRGGYSACGGFAVAERLNTDGNCDMAVLIHQIAAHSIEDVLLF